MFKIIDDNLTMDDLLKGTSPLLAPELGAVIEGRVISKRKNQIIVDLNGFLVGMIAGRETFDSAGTARDLKEGDIVKAVVIEKENEDGMIVLSLRKASQSNTWDRFDQAFKAGEIIDVVVSEANKGGLLLDLDGIKGFIPVSQLAPVHYPRVDNANVAEIYNRLRKLIGQKFKVKVINLDRASGKMILSERAAAQDSAKTALSSLKIGDTVDGAISGVVKFGIFVTFGGLEGLVHISEIAWGHVSNPHQYGKIGSQVKVQIIGIEGDKLSLSMKRLIPDPWEDIAKKYPVASRVQGVVERFSQYGAFVKLEDGLNGLIHLSEISHQKVEDPKDFLSIGDTIEAEVINLDRDEHRIGLSVKNLNADKPLKKKTPPAESDTETAAKAPEDKEETAEKMPKKAAKIRTKKKETTDEKPEPEKAEAAEEPKADVEPKKAAKKTSAKKKAA